MRKPIFTRSRSLPYNETGWLCFKVHLGGGRRGGGGVGGIGNWKNWNLPECVWKRELWFFFFFQAYPKQRRKIIKQPRLICHKLFFRRQTSLQTRHVFFLNLHLLFSYHIHDCISKPSCYLPIKGEKRLRWLKTPMCYGLGPKTNNQCLKNVSELLRNI